MTAYYHAKALIALDHCIKKQWLGRVTAYYWGRLVENSINMLHTRCLGFTLISYSFL